MVSTRYTAITVLLLLFLCQAGLPAFSQYGITLDIQKPEEYENRVLGAEKTDKKKFGLTRRLMQNTITHYNYFFNANNKLNEILERAKAAHRDDYSRLIPFYNYSLDVTAADTTLLDSVSYKAQTGIVLHDLRNDWADNLYLLWGASYYLKKQFDSAYLMFQFINYAFAEKEKDGYYKVIGSARDGNDASSISTKEKNTLTRRIFAEPPSRNDAFIWQIRNYLAQDKFAEAASLIQALQSDPAFPARLHNDLEEVQAYFFYRQQQWDSTAAHLSQALSNATNKQEKARWEYLLGQLYEMTGNNTEAGAWYTKAIGHTTDPIMDIYARLSLVRVNKEGGENYIQENIATLVKMAKRDKYQDYRDIIYYMAAQMELERSNTDGALALLQKSAHYLTDNPAQRNRIFLQLAELSFEKQRYRHSYNFYDSLRLDDPGLKDPDAITARKSILEKIANNIEIIERQDSLQRIAGLPEDERRDFVKRLARQLRRQQGLKDEGSLPAAIFPQQPPSLFADNQRRGEWYFYNSTSRQKGLTDFKAKWGARSNTDNWRRSAAAGAVIRNQVGTDPAITSGSQKDNALPETSEITFEGLYERLPMTPEKIQFSEDSVQAALFSLGLLYVHELEDCNAATETFERLRNRFPAHPQMDEVLFNLYFCYNKYGETAKAAALKKLMTEKFGQSNFTTIVNTGKNPQSKGPGEQATKEYEKVYDLFIEGNFSEAIARKKMADSLYGQHYWTPQLLYIESVYYIKQREDSAAKTALGNIISRFTGTPLAAKAATMLDVLNRRSQIEEELRTMVINRPADDTTTRYRPAPPPVVHNPVVASPVIQPQDSLKTIVPPVAAPVVTTPRTDTAVQAAPSASAYTFQAETPHYVVIVLTKVDPIFVNEARNAFARYNRDTYYNKQMQAELTDIDSDNRLLLISPFKNAQEAVEYVERARPRTASEIVPWLKGGKYSYSIITQKNLDILKNSRNIDQYTQFLEQNLPGRF